MPFIYCCVRIWHFILILKIFLWYVVLVKIWFYRNARRRSQFNVNHCWTVQCTHYTLCVSCIVCIVYFCAEKVQFQSNSNEPTTSFWAIIYFIWPNANWINGYILNRHGFWLRPQKPHTLFMWVGGVRNLNCAENRCDAMPVNNIQDFISLCCVTLLIEH